MDGGKNPQYETPKAKAKPRKWTRRAFLFFLAAGVSYLIFRPQRPPLFQTNKRFIILGFDGVDPRLVERYWDDLPNLQKLAAQGSYSHLKTSTPPESPVAWSSFAVGANPGKHGVYDFLRRPSGSYIPTEESFVGRKLPRFIFDSLPIQMPKAINQRGGTAFWDVLGDNGVPTTLLEVPCTFPPPKLHYGHTLSGLGVPDVRGMQASFHHFVYQPDSGQEAFEETVFGGKVETLKKQSDEYHSVIWGPFDPVVNQKKNDKEKERLLTGLEWTEWKVHLYTLQSEHASEEGIALTRDFFGKRIIQSFSLFTYLQDAETRARIDSVRGFFEAGKPFVKEKDASASTARERTYELLKTWDELSKEIDSLSRPIKEPVTFKIAGEDTVEVTVQGKTQTAKLNEWSDWFSVSFDVTPIIAVHAICRFYPQQLGNQISIFMSSPDIDPRNPAVPISSPKRFSKDLVEWTGGLFKTRGWAAETHGLKDGHLSDEGFLEDLLDLMEKREQKTFESFRRNKSNVFVSVFSETDRVSHMYMRCIDPGHPLYNQEIADKYGDSIKKIWVRMDEIVGRMMKEIEDDPDATLLVMSDHGFQSWRYQVNLNTWLWKNGYMTLKGDSPLGGVMKLDDLLKKDDSSFFANVDWPKTKAYALGLGQVYINLKGREAVGAVDPKDYPDLCREIADQLVQLKDDRPGRDNASAVTEVKLRDEIWHGSYANDAHDCPDLQVGFNEGYRVSWQTCLGGISNVIIEDNLEKWSGDHCSFASVHVPGMFFSSKKISGDQPSIYDFAPTVLTHYGLPLPDEMEGRDLFA
ncbi:MAG: alkaline phosphatase family protein [Candidatus Hinthialibacter antarcticus]|nr:alkaline phosphatase family protein [Candidatus Hinthialibacter antarcticus]